VCPGGARARPEEADRTDYGNQPAARSQAEPIDQSTLRGAGSILNAVPEIVVEMNVDQFNVLQSEFETASNRLNEAKDLAERQALLREIRQIIARMDTFVREMQQTNGR
jgi:ribosomal protein L29